MKRIAWAIWVILAIMFIAFGCITTGQNPTDDNSITGSQAAELRTIGRGIGAGYVLAGGNPVDAKAYCAKFAEVTDLIEAQNLIELALSHFVEGYADKKILIDALTDALIVVGIPVEFDGLSSPELPDLNNEQIDRVRLIVDGFCSMVSIL